MIITVRTKSDAEALTEITRHHPNLGAGLVIMNVSQYTFPVTNRKYKLVSIPPYVDTIVNEPVHCDAAIKQD